MKVRAFAKINLAIEVLGHRADGYHEVITVLQAIGLWDTLHIDPSQRLELRCSATELEGPQNLIWRAARRLQEVTGCSKGARIWLDKRIPIAAGLGGGSSDASAALLALDCLWGLGLGKAGLAPIAQELGSDVPYFLHGGTALTEGRGERVTPMPPLSCHWLVVLCLSSSLPEKTRRLYGGLRREHFSDGDITRRLIASIEDASFRTEMVYNAFEQVASQAFPGYSEAELSFRRAGASAVHLCGSGPSLFSFMADEYHGQEVVKLLQSCTDKAYLVSTL